jgi:hypothetical protein
MVRIYVLCDNIFREPLPRAGFPPGSPLNGDLIRTTERFATQDVAMRSVFF